MNKVCSIQKKKKSTRQNPVGSGTGGNTFDHSTPASRLNHETHGGSA